MWRKLDFKKPIKIIEIKNACKSFHDFSAPPQKFTLSIPRTETEFSWKVALDLIFILKHKPVLDIKDTETYLGLALFIKKNTVE